MLGFLAAEATVPDPATIAGDLANNAGGAMLSAIVSVLPVLIPFLVGLWALAFVVRKIPIFHNSHI
jgi:hypothetical protein